MRRSTVTRCAVLTAVLLAGGLTAQAPAAFGPAVPAFAADASPSPAASGDPSPSPDPTPSPTPAPSPSVPLPTPSASPVPVPSVSPSAGAPTPSPSASASPSPSPSPSARPLPAPGAGVAVLTSDTIQIVALRSLAVRTVTTSGGPVKVIELVADGSNITGPHLQGPCVSAARMDTTAGSLRATGGTTIDLTALQATILGVPVTIAAADLPEGQLTLPGVTLPPLPTDLALLTVKLFVLSLKTGSSSLSGISVSTATC